MQKEKGSKESVRELAILDPSPRHSTESTI
jgi:hypothetical protein